MTVMRIQMDLMMKDLMMYDPDEFDNEMAEKEVVKMFDHFQSDYE